MAGKRGHALNAFHEGAGQVRGVAADLGPRSGGVNPPVGGQCRRRTARGVPGRPDVLRRGLHDLRAAPLRWPSRPPAPQQKCQLCDRRRRWRHLAHEQRARGTAGAELQFISGKLDSNDFGYLLFQTRRAVRRHRRVRTRPATPGPVIGIWKSTDGGRHVDAAPVDHEHAHCRAPQRRQRRSPTRATRSPGRAISSIVVDPNNPNSIYVGSARGVRGVSSVTGSAPPARRLPRPPFGLFNSTDGGADVRLRLGRQRLGPRRQPRRARSGTAASSTRRPYSQGIWRSTNNGGDMDADPRAAAPQWHRQRRPHRVRRHAASATATRGYTWATGPQGPASASRRRSSGAATTPGRRTRRSRT